MMTQLALACLAAVFSAHLTDPALDALHISTKFCLMNLLWFIIEEASLFLCKCRSWYTTALRREVLFGFSGFAFLGLSGLPGSSPMPLVLALTSASEIAVGVFIIVFGLEISKMGRNGSINTMTAIHTFV